MSLISEDSVSKFIAENVKNIIVLHFWAQFSNTTEPMKQLIQDLEKDPECQSLKFCNIDAESLPEISKKYGVRSVPTFVFVKNNSVMHRIEGARPGDVSKRAKLYGSGIGDTIGEQAVITNGDNGTTPSTAAAVVESKEMLNARLKKLINKSKCMIFMKGTPTEPKCGFSRTLVGLLDAENADYGHFDILSDDSVRQGLKEYSDWPTYPQVYIDGELIGGLDIIKEMLASGELQKQLVKKQNLEERLKSLVNRSSVMVFMKGNPSEPKCGFSRTLITLFDSLGATYDTFDILSDEEVRQGLKKYSNWPTYPQVYVNGELIGGLDIIKELNDTDRKSVV